MLCGGQDPQQSGLRLPREYVTTAKQERIRKTAAFYLMEKGLDCPVRFDVAESIPTGRTPSPPPT